MNDDQIKYMVDRFLMWRLPEHFSPDCGISFKKTHSERGPLGPQKYEPVGTNLFSAEQAREMVRHIVDGMPSEAPDSRGQVLPASEAAKESKNEVQPDEAP